MDGGLRAIAGCLAGLGWAGHACDGQDGHSGEVDAGGLPAMNPGDEMDPELAALMAAHGVAKTAEGKPGEAPGAPAVEPTWSIAQSRFLENRRRAVHGTTKARTGAKQFIKPENALTVVRRLPGPGETTHCILRGDFVVGDLLTLLLDGNLHCPHLRLATLGMSHENAKTIAALVKTGKVGRCSLVLSHYFASVNKSTVFFDVEQELAGLATITVMRNHAKIVAMERQGAGPEDWLAIETSANLRSSDNLEQMTIFNDRDVHDFHAEWIDHVRDNPPET